MTESDTEANTALLLDEKIEERIHIAVGRLFGYDASKHYMIPPPSQTRMPMTYADTSWGKSYAKYPACL
jgi:hypothetical protein